MLTAIHFAAKAAACVASIRTNAPNAVRVLHVGIAIGIIMLPIVGGTTDDDEEEANDAKEDDATASSSVRHLREQQ